MKTGFTGAAALMLSAAPVLAGGLERAPQSIGVLFEQGNYAELSFGGVDPTVKGTDAPIPGVYPGGASTGDVAQGYGFFGLAYKHQFNDRLSGAIIVEQPFGADILYPMAPEGTPVLNGTRVEVNSTTYTALLRYKFDSNFSVHGGLRASYADGHVTLDGAGYLDTAGYDLDIDGEWGVGYVVGAAYEIPQVAGRVSLTYNSPIEHDFTMSETGGLLGAATVVGDYTVKTPRSWTLEGQTGIAADTLLFGSIRWVKWSEFKVDNFMFPMPVGAGVPLVEVEDTTTYTIGVGRKFTDRWSGAMSFVYEPREGDSASPLAPTNGRKAVTLAAIHTMDQLKITAGINYTRLGDADLGIGETGDKVIVARTDDNDAWGFGVKVGYSF